MEEAHTHPRRPRSVAPIIIRGTLTYISHTTHSRQPYDHQTPQEAPKMAQTHNHPQTTPEGGRIDARPRSGAVLLSPARVMPPMSEKNLQSAVEKLARFSGWLVYHTHDSRRSPAGFPDLVMVSGKRGRVIYRELKSAAGKLRPEQITWLDELTAAGEDAGVWRPADLVSGRIVAELRCARNDD